MRARVRSKGKCLRNPGQRVHTPSAELEPAGGILPTSASAGSAGPEPERGSRVRMHARAKVESPDGAQDSSARAQPKLVLVRERTRSPCLRGPAHCAG
jgi:hypothetical protein